MKFQTYINRTMTENKVTGAHGQTIDELIQSIEELTDENDHTKAVLELARFLTNEKSIKILNAIKTMHNVYGSLPTQLIELRDIERKELIKNIEKNYGKDIAQKVNAAF